MSGDKPGQQATTREAMRTIETTPTPLYIPFNSNEDEITAFLTKIFGTDNWVYETRLHTYKLCGVTVPIFNAKCEKHPYEHPYMITAYFSYKPDFKGMVIRLNYFFE